MLIVETRDKTDGEYNSNTEGIVGIYNYREKFLLGNSGKMLIVLLRVLLYSSSVYAPCLSKEEEK